MPEIGRMLAAKGVEMRCCADSLALLAEAGIDAGKLVAATEADWREEYLAPIIAVKLVDGLDDAIAHINTYSSAHTDTIVTGDEAAARRFLQEVDSASVLWNASTRMADGGCYGLGAETDELPAYVVLPDARGLPAGSTIFFTANDGTSGVELWKTDGTNAGTVRVKDINPGAASSTPNQLMDFNGTLFFVAEDAAGGVELWKSDGSDAGTVRVRDIYPGTLPSNPTQFVVFNSLLFFAATDAATGTELWKSDGTTAGTVQVRDVNTGGPSSNPTSISPLASDTFCSCVRWYDRMIETSG